MHKTFTSSLHVRSWAVLLVSWFLAEVATSVRADVIFLKDGSILTGKARREGKLEIENGQGIVIPKGFFYVDNGPRRLYFSPRQVEQVDDRSVKAGALLSRPWPGGRIYLPPGTKMLRGLISQGESTPWDEDWNRKIKVEVEDRGTVVVSQHLTAMNAYYAVADAYRGAKWNAYYLVEELGPRTITELIRLHPDLRIDPKMKEEERINRHLKIFNFYREAGWHDLAMDRLKLIYQQFPKHKKELAKEEKKLWKDITKAELQDIKQAIEVNQFERAAALIKRFSSDFSTPDILNGVQIAKLELEQRTRKLEQARQALQEHLAGITDPEEKLTFDTAVKVILEEIGTDTVSRLDTFLKQSEQAERRKSLKLPPTQTPSQLLSLAVTGWVMGNTAAETNYKAVMRLWSGREFLEKYLLTDNKVQRAILLDRYVKTKTALEPDEMAELITRTIPINADSEFKDLQITEQTGSTTYHVQLPPEYHPRRAYPLLIVLHDKNGSAKEMRDRWTKQAAENGYIVAAVEWSLGPFAQKYEFSAEEHNKVLRTVEDARRKFHVDDDRIFLFGQGEGGTMAFDVGQSHPDYFAGVIPMSPAFHFVTRQYCNNAQYLPFYVVGGDHAGDQNVQTRKQFERWMPKGYVATFVQYKGRGREWFGGEVRFIFDWMNRKKRYFPLKQLGHGGNGQLGNQFKTFRSTDNSFYWVTTTGIGANNENGNPNWNNLKIPASIYGHASLKDNHIYLYPSGFKQLTVWLGRSGQVDLTKEVKITIRGRLVRQAKVKPSLSVLLERFYERRDRKQLFVARIDFGK